MSTKQARPKVSEVEGLGRVRGYTSSVLLLP